MFHLVLHEIDEVLVDVALQKGENLENIMTEANRLESNAGEFKVRARSLKCTMCVENIKWCIIAIVLVVVRFFDFISSKESDRPNRFVF